jgi:hypothetical protein
MYWSLTQLIKASPKSASKSKVGLLTFCMSKHSSITRMLHATCSLLHAPCSMLHVPCSMLHARPWRLNNMSNLCACLPPPTRSPPTPKSLTHRFAARSRKSMDFLRRAVLSRSNSPKSWKGLSPREQSSNLGGSLWGSPLRPAVGVNKQKVAHTSKCSTLCNMMALCCNVVNRG